MACAPHSFGASQSSLYSKQCRCSAVSLVGACSSFCSAGEFVRPRPVPAQVTSAHCYRGQLLHVKPTGKGNVIACHAKLGRRDCTLDEFALAGFPRQYRPLAWHAFLPCPQSLQAGHDSHWQQRAPAVQEAVRTTKGLALLLCMQRLLQHAQEPWRRLRGRLHAPHTTVIRLRKERLCWRSSVQETKCMSKLITPCAFNSSELQVLQV